MSYAGNSNVGFPSIYEDGNQRHISQSQVDDLAQHSGKNVKGYRPQDQNAAVNEHYMEESAKEREEAVKRDPTLAVSLTAYPHNPSCDPECSTSCFCFCVCFSPLPH
ncbi:hypothetical protein SMACR_07131 [Sordaria macrospora]|uniref:Uncharacterized protein n=1 Tax=Sordaria macrospora TaxID=5147 RepID=A0A8S8ZZ52_SORMA|nr:hypothetical protein SMACR_07131 [Sordaria macrospora]